MKNPIIYLFVVHLPTLAAAQITQYSVKKVSALDLWIWGKCITQVIRTVSSRTRRQLFKNFRGCSLLQHKSSWQTISKTFKTQPTTKSRHHKQKKRNETTVCSPASAALEFQESHCC
jgi:hypothetical protein